MQALMTMYRTTYKQIGFTCSLLAPYPGQKPLTMSIADYLPRWLGVSHPLKVYVTLHHETSHNVPNLLLQ